MEDCQLWLCADPRRTGGAGKNPSEAGDDPLEHLLLAERCHADRPAEAACEPTGELAHGHGLDAALFALTASTRQAQCGERWCSAQSSPRYEADGIERRTFVRTAPQAIDR
jgi:hypothetical protein